MGHNHDYYARRPLDGFQYDSSEIQQPSKEYLFKKQMEMQGLVTSIYELLQSVPLTRFHDTSFRVLLSNIRTNPLLVRGDGAVSYGHFPHGATMQLKTSTSRSRELHYLSFYDNEPDPVYTSSVFRTGLYSSEEYSRADGIVAMVDSRTAPQIIPTMLGKLTAEAVNKWPNRIV